MSGTYFYTVTMSGGKVKGIPRGEAVVATVPYDDLGANDGSGANGSRLPLRLVSDIETPAHEVINYINLSANLQQGSEKTDRLVSTSAVTLTPLEVSIGMTPDEAKGVIDTVLRDRASAVLAGRISLLRLDYPTLEPGDCITAVGINGSEYRLRIVQIVERFPLLDCDVVLDDPNVLSGQGITTTDYESQTTVSAPAQTMLRLLDIPILRNEDDYSGPYAFAKGTRTPYPGSAVFGSPDDIDYTRMSTINEAAIFGTCVTALGDWNGPRVVDFKNTVRVSVGAGVQLASSTRSAVLASQAVNAFAIGSDATGYELGQFIDAEEVSDGVYDLSNFLRGSRGTEWRMTGHASGERFYLLRFEGVRKLRLENAQLGASRYYKGVTLGRSIGSAMAQAFTTLGVAQKPFSPSQVRVSRDSSNNATITITRRTRLGVRYTGPLGFSVPLGEQTEAYSIDVYADDTYTTIVRTASLIGTNVIEYTASLQTADGLTPGDPLHMKAYQLSAIVGRGYALQRAA
jgi:hypothetical protein